MKSTMSVLTFILMGSTLSACANSQFLRAMNVTVTEQNSENFVNLSAEVDLGNLAIDGLTIPVVDPHNNLNIGKVTFGAAPSGKELITVSLDATSMLHADPTLGSTLPNGRALPSSLGVAAGEMLAIPVLNYSRVYIGGDLKSTIVIGAAFGIKALDQPLGTIGLNSNIFFAQNFSPILSGVAGIYASPTANENGIAVFGKYTAPTTTTTGTATSVSIASAAPAMAAKTQARMMVASNAPVAPISASGVTGAGGNTVINDQMSSSGEQKVYSTFYGKKRKVTPQ